MSKQTTTPAVPADERTQRERLLRILSAATFLVFFQAYMVAPLIPHFVSVFGVPEEGVGLVVPAYLFPYGISTLFFGILSDRIGRKRILFASLSAFIVLTAFTATAQSVDQLIGWRIATGLGASGVVPLALALIGDLFPFEKRGRPLGWLFGAMAGGAAFGSTFGVMLEPLVGWRFLFVAVAMMGVVLFLLLAPQAAHIDAKATRTGISIQQVMDGYRALLLDKRGLRTYGYVLVNGIFHSGVFTWLGLLFVQRYGLGEIGIGLALLGYGVPGFLLGPVIGRLADRFGRRWLVPAGLAIGALGAALLIPKTPVVVAALAVTVLSLGYDMTQPLLAGIVTALGGKRGGQAMGLNVFTLFTAFGLGSLLFGRLLTSGITHALWIFFSAQLLFALAAMWLFRTEIRQARIANACPVGRSSPSPQ